MSDTSIPVWERRFRVPVLGMATWSPATPDRIVGRSSESGTYRIHAWDLSPLLQACDRALLGCHTPAAVPELMQDRSPISYVDEVRAPLLTSPARTTAAVRSAGS